MNDVVFAEQAEELRLYDGKVKLYFDADLHVYYTDEDGERSAVAGVTSVCGMMDKSGPLTQWAANSTVGWIMENIPCEPLVRYELEGLYTLVKAKAEIKPRPYSLVNISTDALAKLLNDARFNYRKISRDATDIGHAAHTWLEQHIKALIAGTVYTGPLPDDPKAQNCIKAALDWMTKHDFQPLYSERKIFSQLHGYAGTLDWIGNVTSCGNPACCPFEGTLTELGDFKSSRSIYEEYFIQTAAYEFAILEEMDDLVIAHRRILRLGKEDGEFETQTRGGESFELDFMAFIGMLQAYNWKQQLDLDSRQDKLDTKLAKAAKKAAEKAAKVKITAVKRPRLKKAGHEPIPVAS